jgi:transposase
VAGNETVFIYDGAPAHRGAVSPAEEISLRMLPPYSPFLNIVENAISALKAAIKNDISRPELNTPFTITPLGLISQCTCLVILSQILPWPGSIQSHETRQKAIHY